MKRIVIKINIDPKDKVQFDTSISGKFTDEQVKLFFTYIEMSMRNIENKFIPKYSNKHEKDE